MSAWLGYSTTTLVAVVSILFTYFQIRRSRLQQRVDLLFRMEDIFFQREKAERVKAARGIQEGNFLEAEPILDQFETIALLVDKGALDRYMVWHTFFYWMDNYYEACSTYIKARQKDDPIYWQDLAKLVPELRAFDAKKRGVSSRANKPTQEDILEFLQEEIKEA